MRRGEWMIVLIPFLLMVSATQAQPTTETWATRVVGCLAKLSDSACNDHMDCEAALGIADYIEIPSSGYVSLGGGIGSGDPSEVSGFIVLQLGFEECALNGPGPDLVVYEPGDPEQYEVLVSDLEDGPFVSIGFGTGETSFEFSDYDVLYARYVKIIDRNDSADNTCHPGADIDAVEFLHSGPVATSPVSWGFVKVRYGY